MIFGVCAWCEKLGTEDCGSGETIASTKRGCECMDPKDGINPAPCGDYTPCDDCGSCPCRYLKRYLIGTNNEGYAIIAQGKKAVIACNLKAPNQYVTWSYKYTSNGEVMFETGSYGDLEHVTKRFYEKEDIK